MKNLEKPFDLTKTKIQVGQKYGRLTAVEPIARDKKKQYVWKFLCDCGNTHTGSAYTVKKGELQSCGCLGNGRFPDKKMVGQKINCLTVTGYFYQNKKYNSLQYTWVCECGKIGHSNSGKIKKTNSCGCKNLYDYTKGIPLTYFTLTKNRAIKKGYDFNLDQDFLWNLLVTQNFKCAYTGLEIRCATQKRNVENKASLDRIDSSKGYVKGNVQWVHVKVNFMKQQMSDQEFIDFCVLIAKNRGS